MVNPEISIYNLFIYFLEEWCFFESTEKQRNGRCCSPLTLPWSTEMDAVTPDVAARCRRRTGRGEHRYTPQPQGKKEKRRRSRRNEALNRNREEKLK